MARRRALTAQQEAFCQSYVTCRNGAAAARAAGYSELAAKEQASRLLSRPHVQERVRELTRERLDYLQPVALEVLADIMLDPGAPHRDRRAAAEAILERGYLRRVSRTETQVEHTFNPSAIIAEIWAARKAEEVARRLPAAHATARSGKPTTRSARLASAPRPQGRNVDLAAPLP